MTFLHCQVEMTEQARKTAESGKSRRRNQSGGGFQARGKRFGYSTRSMRFRTLALTAGVGAATPGADAGSPEAPAAGMSFAEGCPVTSAPPFAAGMAPPGAPEPPP